MALIDAIQRIPIRGVGISTDVEPDPVWVSDVLRPDYVELIYLQPKVVQAVADQFPGTPFEFHHADIEFYEPAGVTQRFVDAARTVIDILHPHWCNVEMGSMRVGSTLFDQFIFPFLDTDTLTLMADRLRQFQAAVPEVLVTFENPAPLWLCPGGMTLSDYMRQLADATQCGILLDLTHLYSLMQLQHATMNDFAAFPWEYVVQIHVAGSRAFDKILLDDHTAPIQSGVLALLAEVLPKCTNIRGVAYEMDFVSKPIARDMFPQVRRVVESVRPDLQPQAGSTLLFRPNL